MSSIRSSDDRGKALSSSDEFRPEDISSDSPNGLVAGLVRGMSRFPRVLSVAKKAIANKIVGQFPKKLAVQKVGKLSDLTSFLLELWSNFRNVSDSHASRTGILQLFKVTTMSMARSTLTGTSAFMAFEKSYEISMTVSGTSNVTERDKAHVPFAPGVWIFSSLVAGTGHTAVGIAWDVLLAREVMSAAAIRVAWASSLASHSCLFTTYFGVKSVLFNRLDCDPASPAGVLSIAAAGAASGGAAHVAETLVPDELSQKPSRRGGVWAELVRRSRLLSFGSTVRAAPATVVAFLAYEFADSG